MNDAEASIAIKIAQKEQFKFAKQAGITIFNAGWVTSEDGSYLSKVSGQRVLTTQVIVKVIHTIKAAD